MLDTLKCYELLGVEPGCAAERVRHAYVDLKRTWDVERYFNDPKMLEVAKKKAREIDEAYRTLASFLPLEKPYVKENAVAGQPQKEYEFGEDVEENSSLRRILIGVAVGVLAVILTCSILFLVVPLQFEHYLLTAVYH